MNTLNNPFKYALLAASVALASGLTATTVMAEQKAVDMNITEVNGEVRLLVKRERPDGSTTWERLQVAIDQADEKEAELLQDPNVLMIERGAVSYSPIPLVKPMPSRSQAYSASAQSAETVSYSDPLFGDQQYFGAGDTFNSRLSEAHGRLNFSSTVRVGIVDGGFVQTPEVTYTEGASTFFAAEQYRGPQFYNSDPNITCPELAPGEPRDTHGHWVSQVLGANSNNGIGIAGATRNVELVAARSMNCRGVGFLDDNAESVRWLAGATDIPGVPTISEPVDIINMSLESQTACPTFLQDAIDFARSQGAIVVVAAGNNFSDVANYAPANCNGVITVAASSPTGLIADYTNFGDNVDITAQGSDITVLDDQGNPTVIDGTSFATPLVAGVIAAAMSDRPVLNENLVNNILATSGKPLRTFGGDTGGASEGTGAGILDAMLFLDGAGIARETITLQPALDGEREQFADALTHPAATSYLSARLGGNTSACDLVQVDGNLQNNPAVSDEVAVFTVAQGDLLSPRSVTVDFARRSATDTSFVFSRAQLESEVGANRQLAVAQCDIGSGSNCSVRDTVKALDISNLPTPSACNFL